MFRKARPGAVLGDFVNKKQEGPFFRRAFKLFKWYFVVSRGAAQDFFSRTGWEASRACSKHSCSLRKRK